VSSVYGGSTGDLFVAFSVVLPRSLTKHQRQLLQEYADDVEGRNRAPPAKAEASSSHEDEFPNNDNVKAQIPTDSVEDPPLKEQEAKKKATG